MNSKQEWNDNKNHGDADLSALLNPRQLKKLQSNSPIEKIKINLLKSMTAAAILCIGYIALIIYFHEWMIRAAIGITLIFSFWALITAWKEFRKLQTGIDTSNSLLEEMKRHTSSIRRWMAIEQRVAIFVYPISAAGGFMLGGTLGSGKPVADFLSKPIVLIALLVAIAVLVPTCHWLAKWLAKKSFGQHIDALERNIRELENEK